jgi:hypothetical protein
MLAEKSKIRHPDNVQSSDENGSGEPEGRRSAKPWPIAWILIAILLYVLLQTAWLVWGS